MLNGDEIARIPTVVANFTASSVDVPLCTKTIAKLRSARDYGDISLIVELCNAMKAVADDAEFGIELRIVSHLLKIAASAAPNVLTGRLYPRRRRLQNGFDLGKPDLAALDLFE